MSRPNDLSLVFGTVDAIISEVIDTVPQAFAGGDVIITYMDSTTVLNAISLEYLSEHGIEFECGLAALRIFEKCAAKFLQKLKILEGFDELLIAKAGTPLDSYSFAATQPPTYTLQKSVADQYIALFKDTGAMRYYSDGVGLNYAVEPEVAQLLDRAYPVSEQQGRLF